MSDFMIAETCSFVLILNTNISMCEPYLGFPFISVSVSLSFFLVLTLSLLYIC